MTKIIFISIPWFSPAFKAGGPIQSIVNMVAALNEGYQFYIYTGNTDLHGQPIAVANTNEWIHYNAYTKVWYAAKQDRSQNLVAQVETIKPDVLYIIGLFDWHFNMVPLLYAKCRNKILSVRGMLHPGALSQKAFKKKLFLKAFKWVRLQRKIKFQATDNTEAVFIKKIFKKANVFVAGNFPRILQPQAITSKLPGELKMLSIGIISPMKNYGLVLQALKGVKATITYSIYGPVKEPAYWEECLQTIQQLPANIHVNYHKEITPNDVPSKLEGNHLFILPSKSENFGHAIAEALSAGLPVITSNTVPWLGLAAANAGENVEPTTENLKNVIEKFSTMEEKEWMQYCKGAGEYILKRVDVDDLKKDYAIMFDL